MPCAAHAHDGRAVSCLATASLAVGFDDRFSTAGAIALGFALASAVAIGLTLRQRRALARAHRQLQELRLPEDELRRVINVSPLPAALLERNGRIAHTNSRFLEAFGYTLAEIPNLESWWKLAYPDPPYREKVISEWCGRITAAPADTTVAPYETRVTCRDGTQRIIEWRATATHACVVVFGTDLTERLRAEEALRANEERHRLLLEHSPEAVLVFDAVTRQFVDCNQRAEAMFRLPRAELLKIGLADLSAPQQPDNLPVTEGIDRYIAAALAGEYPVFEWKSRDATGREFSCEIRLVRLPAPVDRTLIRSSLVDISGRKESEDALREREERFRLLIENSTELVAQVDGTGRLVYVSPNHAAITGYAPEEMLGHGVFEFIHPDDAPQVLQAFQSRSEQATRIFRYRFKDGSWHWLESAGRRFLTSGRVEMAAVISRDITQRIESEEARKQLELQLRQAQKMEAIGTLAGGIAHDFNNILTGLFGNLRLAQEQLAPAHGAQTFLAASYRACERARDLVAKILTFSRRHEPVRQVHALSPILREAAGLLRASLPATIDIRVEEATPDLTVQCDASQIHQVIMNLGANAAHAMRERGGILTLRLDEVPPDDSALLAHPGLAHRPVARLTVRDTGHGMDAATRDRIFEPFFTTKPVGEGTGLGLAVVHGIVEDHHGAIAVETAPGAGTTIHLWFPRVEKLAGSAAAAPAKLGRGAGERVLLVDDEPAIADVACRIVRRLGYNVACFTNPREALAAFEKAPADFDLLVTDLTMPELTGPELAECVRRVRPDFPVLVTTGYLRVGDLDRARAAGLEQFLEKPFTLEALADALRRALGK